MPSKPTLTRYISAYLPPILWALLIFSLSAQSTLPGPPVSWMDFFFKKFGHIGVYAVLWWLVHRGLVLAHPQQSKYATWLPMLLVLAYATSDELHQLYTPDRHPAIRDIGYDMLGAATAWLRRYGYI